MLDLKEIFWYYIGIHSAIIQTTARVSFKMNRLFCLSVHSQADI